MPYLVQFTPVAAAQLRALRAVDATRIADECQRILSVNPTLESKARIKRLRSNVFPPYRLRVGEYRIFYDVDEAGRMVRIYGIVSKDQANTWLSTAQKEPRNENENAG